MTMTLEEKARAYDEALERANKQRADYQKELDKTDKNSQLAGLLRAGISAIDMAFPELRESEDERIRRTLVEYFGPQAQLDFVRGIPIQKIRDWLEKQKGDKDELVYRLNGLMQDYIKEGKDDEEKEHRLKCYQLFWDALEDTNFFDQKEQKPVLTAKEAWKEMRLEVYAQASGNRHEPNYSDDSTKMFSLCDIDEIFEKIGNSTVEQKPAEWSEEDKKMLADTIFKLAGFMGNEKNIAWLKSLRPSWKPSEEQMNALLSARFLYRDGLENSATASALESLYVDLENL